MAKTSKNKNSAKPAAVNAPKAPADLQGVALEEWDRIVGELRIAGLLDQTDRALIHLYCRTWATWFEADQAVASQGAVAKYSGPNVGLSQHYKIKANEAKTLATLINAMGLTPSQRKTREAKTNTQTETGPKRLDF